MTTRRAGLVTDEGTPVTLLGTPVAVGDAAPDFRCVVQEPGSWTMREVGVDDAAGRLRLYSVVPSLDTPVCSRQTQRFDAEVAAFGDAVAAYAVSVDTPYAAGRFCRGKEIGPTDPLYAVSEHVIPPYRFSTQVKRNLTLLLKSLVLVKPSR